MYCNTIVFLLRIPDCNPSIAQWIKRVQVPGVPVYPKYIYLYFVFGVQVPGTTYYVLLGLFVHALHQGHQVLVLYIPGIPCTRTPRDQSLHSRQCHTP